MLRHLRAVTCLGFQFERWLEEVDVEPRNLVKGSKDFRGLQTLQPSVADQAANDSAILLLDPRVVVLLVCTRPRKLDTHRFAEVEHRLVHGGIVVAIQTAQGKRQRTADLLDMLQNECAAAKRHGQAFGPSRRDISHHKRVHELAVDLAATTVLHEIDLEIAGQRIVPVREGPDRHGTVNSTADSAGASVLAIESLLAHVVQQPVNGGGADLLEPLVYALR